MGEDDTFELGIVDLGKFEHEESFDSYANGNTRDNHETNC